jgi:hypothetical protein
MREPTHVESIGCYDRADLDGSVTVVSSTATDPVAACAALWRSGVVSETTDVPELTACVLHTGAIAVMPGPVGICEGLGIASLSAEGRRRLIQAGALNAALAARFGDATGATARTRCVGETEAKRIVAAELRARGLQDWSVEVRAPFDADRRCAFAEVVPADKTVELISLEP